MGQAKNRGTKEQRIIEGERIASIKEATRKRILQLQEDNLSPEEKEKRAKARAYLASLLSFMPDTLRVNKALKMLS